MAENKEKQQYYLLSRKKVVGVSVVGIIVAVAMAFAGYFIGNIGKEVEEGTVWQSGKSYTEFENAKDGDYFIDVDDYILYQKAETGWEVVIENYGRPVNEPPTPTIKEWDEVGVTIGNVYASSYEVLKNRSSATQNIYLKAGQSIQIADVTTYKYFLYKQYNSTPTLLIDNADKTAIMSEWSTFPYYIREDGWYGVCFAKNDDSNFDREYLKSKTLGDFFIVEEVENDDIAQFSMVTGHQYSQAGTSYLNRASINKNIFLTAGTTISLVTPSEYKIAVYTQNDENREYYTQSSNGVDIITEGYQTANVTINNTGYYGIVIVKTNDADFDFETESINASHYITITAPSE